MIPLLLTQAAAAAEPLANVALIRYGIPGLWVLGAALALYFTVQVLTITRAIDMAITWTVDPDVDPITTALRSMFSHSAVIDRQIRVAVVIGLGTIGVIALFNFPLAVSRLLSTLDLLVVLGLTGYKSYAELQMFRTAYRLLDVRAAWPQPPEPPPEGAAP